MEAGQTVNLLPLGSGGSSPSLPTMVIHNYEMINYICRDASNGTGPVQKTDIPKGYGSSSLPHGVYMGRYASG